MTQNFYEEIKRQAKLNKAFQYMEGTTWKVCTDLSIMPYRRQTLGNYIINLENGYNAKIEALEKRCDKLETINAELIKALETLNK